MSETTELPWMVSVDDHLVEPPNLWTDRLPSRFRDQGPRVEQEFVWLGRKEKGRADIRTSDSLGDGMSNAERVRCDVWHYEDVRIPMLRFGAFVDAREDADMEPITYEDMRPGCYEWSARLNDMDADGVGASLCFPNLFVRFCGQRFLEAKDKELALLCVRAYNDFLHEEWAEPSGGRLLGAAIIPLWDADAAAAEVRRNAERGFRAVCFSEIPVRLGLPSMYSKFWDPFFEACNETETVINVHIGSSSTVHTTSSDAPFGIQTANHFSNSAFSLSDWLLCGAFHQFPQLKVAFSEGQAGWIPYLLSRLDGLWRNGNSVAEIRQAVPEPPSSYMKGHVYACVFDDPTAMTLLAEIGVDSVCFETDYPHESAAWPNSRAIAAELTRGLSPEMRDRVLVKNGAALLGIDTTSALWAGLGSDSRLGQEIGSR